MIVKGRKDSKGYCEIIDHGFLPVAAEVFGGQITLEFQQDNFQTHIYGYIINWINFNTVYTIPWPAKYPDINIIENVWGVLARRVYARVRKFKDVEGLVVVVREQWGLINTLYVQKLYR